MLVLWAKQEYLIENITISNFFGNLSAIYVPFPTGQSLFKDFIFKNNSISTKMPVPADCIITNYGYPGSSITIAGKWEIYGSQSVLGLDASSTAFWFYSDDVTKRWLINMSNWIIMDTKGAPALSIIGVDVSIDGMIAINNEGGVLNFASRLLYETTEPQRIKRLIQNSYFAYNGDGIFQQDRVQGFVQADFPSGTFSLINNTFIGNEGGYILEIYTTHGNISFAINQQEVCVRSNTWKSEDNDPFCDEIVVENIIITNTTHSVQGQWIGCDSLRCYIKKLELNEIQDVTYMEFVIQNDDYDTDLVDIWWQNMDSMDNKNVLGAVGLKWLSNASLSRAIVADGVYLKIISGKINYEKGTITNDALFQFINNAVGIFHKINFNECHGPLISATNSVVVFEYSSFKNNQGHQQSSAVIKANSSMLLFYSTVFEHNSEFLSIFDSSYDGYFYDQYASVGYGETTLTNSIFKNNFNNDYEIITYGVRELQIDNVDLYVTTI